MKLNYFNFCRFGNDILLTNDLGNYIFIKENEFKSLLQYKSVENSEVRRQLEEAGFLYDGSDQEFAINTMYPLRNSKSYLATASSLHIFVVTTACNLNCLYCQANNGKITPDDIMSEETAILSVDIALQSPERNLSFEFQGGEPLINYRIIEQIVEYAEENKGNHRIEYSIVSNLSLLTDEMVDFFERYSFNISTSIDGKEELHNHNRPAKNTMSSYQMAKKGIEKCRERGIKVGALQTTTRYSLKHAKEIVDSYVEMGFDSIFIRHLTRLGKASAFWDKIGYEADEFIEFYREALNIIIEYNKNGIDFREQHAAMFLRRIMGQRLNYMELRSPCGGGIGQIAYYTDGRVFTCDEGRMLAEMGNDAFLLGNVYEDDYSTMIKGAVCQTVCKASILESIPSCCDCVYQPYCGTCPVANYAINGDIIEKTPRSFRCLVYKGILDTLFSLIRTGDGATMAILDKWSR